MFYEVRKTNAILHSCAWLDKAVEYGDPGLGVIVTENLFDKIHGDPRWLAFLRKIGKAPEQLAKIEFKVTPPQWSRMGFALVEALATGQPRMPSGLNREAADNSYEGPTTNRHE